jgi:hypothetical protein
VGYEKGFASFISSPEGNICLDESNALLRQNSAGAEFCLKTGKQESRLVKVVKNGLTERGFTMMMCLKAEDGDDTVFTDQDFANNYRISLTE